MCQKPACSFEVFETRIRVMNVVNGIVEQIPRERVDREYGTVAASSCSRPGVGRKRVESIREHRPRCLQIQRYLYGVLLVVAVCDGSPVLIPILVEGIVVFDHEYEASVEELEDVAYVAGVFERRPPLIRRSNTGQRRLE